MINTEDITGLAPGVTAREHALLNKLDSAEASLSLLVSAINVARQKQTIPPPVPGEVDDDLAMIHRTLEESGFNFKHYGLVDGLDFESLPVHLMTDQPPTCPKCGCRVQTWLRGEETDKQVVRCRPCAFTWRLEADDEEP